MKTFKQMGRIWKILGIFFICLGIYFHDSIGFMLGIGMIFGEYLGYLEAAEYEEQHGK